MKMTKHILVQKASYERLKNFFKLYELISAGTEISLF